jgi:predicted SprT family Zn-dependent metalloprotease
MDMISLMSNTNMTIDDALEYMRQATRLFMDSSMRQDYKDKLANMTVRVVFNSRLKSTGGRARLGRNRAHDIELNPTVMKNATPDERFNTTAHELAHCLDYEIRGRSNHDKFWKSLHLAMGGSAERCHRINMKGIRGRVWFVKCRKTGKTWWVTAKKAGSVKRALNANQYIILHMTDPELAKHEVSV